MPETTMHKGAQLDPVHLCALGTWVCILVVLHDTPPGQLLARSSCLPSPCLPSYHWHLAPLVSTGWGWGKEHWG